MPTPKLYQLSYCTACSFCAVKLPFYYSIA